MSALIHKPERSEHEVATEVSKPNTMAQNSRVYLVALTSYAGIFLFGYDTGVAGGLTSLPSFAKALDYDTKSATEQIAVKSWIVSILMLGAFAGSIAAAPFAQKYGRKWSLVGFTVVFLVGAIVQTAAHSLGEMYAGRFVAGLGVGGMSMICPLYVAEMCPKDVRGRITGMFQIVVVIGVAISYWLEYGLSLHSHGEFQWRFPLAFQIIPCIWMLLVIPFFLRESPRWLVYDGQHDKALENLAWARKRSPNDTAVIEELAEIQAAIQEERDATSGASWREMFVKGSRIRFFIAFAMFFLQQWSGQNSISYYAPLIFQSIGLKGTSTGLFASGIYGIVKIVATSVFVFIGIEKIGRSKALGGGGLLMSMFLWIIGAVYFTHRPDVNADNPSSSSIAMAAMIYCFVIPYCFSWGPVPWVYCSEIFPMRMRHLGMATASSVQWIFNFCISKITPTLVANLPNGRLFFLFAALNLLSAVFGFSLPETKGVSIEQMDVIFGSVTQEERDRYIDAQLRAAVGSQMGSEDENKPTLA